jgi:hypothetical protein
MSKINMTKGGRRHGRSWCNPWANRQLGLCGARLDASASHAAAGNGSGGTSVICVPLTRKPQEKPHRACTVIPASGPPSGTQSQLCASQSTVTGSLRDGASNRCGSRPIQQNG